MKSIYVPLNHDTAWLPDAIERKRKELEDQGIRISRNNLVRKALEKAFAPNRGSAHPLAKPIKYLRPSLKVEVRIPKHLRWLSDAIYKIANLKRSLGIDPEADFNSEFIRFAINGYKNTKVGSELDRLLLESDYRIPEEESESE